MAPARLERALFRLENGRSIPAELRGRTIEAGAIKFAAGIERATGCM
jgi:hypothetical protein